MSTNCTHAKYIRGELRLPVAKLAEFQRLELPATNFLQIPSSDRDAGDEVVIVKPWWCGDWSGNSFDTLRDTILPASRGSADLVFIWEGGEGFTGLRVEDGKVTEHDVEFPSVPRALLRSSSGLLLPR